MSAILVINSGSSSLKYSLIDIEQENLLASGLIERIGQEVSPVAHTVRPAVDGDAVPTMLDATYRSERPIADHAAAFEMMREQFAAHGPSLEEHRPVAVGHRVVHGGARFYAPTLIDADVERQIDELAVLAPLHNPANLAGIVAARAVFDEVPHVAVFDTAFHQTLPPAAYTYAIDAALAAEHRVRRYGFHGTSHQYVSAAAADFLGRDLADLRQLVFHLGNGASVTAIDGGRSVETSMGLTPLEGLVMGTRSVTSIPRHSCTCRAVPVSRSTTSTPCSTPAAGSQASPDAATCATSSPGSRRGRPRRFWPSTCTCTGCAPTRGLHRTAGGVDVISFTAGVGENAAPVRAAAMATLGFAGVEIDPVRNAARERGIRRISADASPVTVLVVPTDEELQIARQTAELI